MIDEPVQNACGQLEEAELDGRPEDPLLGPGAQVLGDHGQDEGELDARSRGRWRRPGCWPPPRRTPAAGPRLRGRWAGWFRPGPPRPAAARSSAGGNRPAAAGRARTSRNRPASSGGPRPAAPAAGGYSRAGSRRRRPSHRPTRARCSSASRRSIWSIASRTQSRRSVETWSLRLRAVCSFRPTSPIRSTRARSTCMWISSSSARKGNRPCSISRRISPSDCSIWRHSSAVSSPTLASIWAWAIEAVDVLRIKPAIEAHALGELLDAAVRRLVEHPAPRLLGHWTSSPGNTKI